MLSANTIGPADVAPGLVRSTRQRSVELVPKGSRSILNSGGPAAHPVDPQRIMRPQERKRAASLAAPFCQGHCQKSDARIFRSKFLRQEWKCRLCREYNHQDDAHAKARLFFSTSMIWPAGPLRNRWSFTLFTWSGAIAETGRQRTKANLRKLPEKTAGRYSFFMPPPDATGYGPEEIHQQQTRQ